LGCDRGFHGCSIDEHIYYATKKDEKLAFRRILSCAPGEVGLGVTFADGGYIYVPDSPALENQTFSFAAWAMPAGPGPGRLGEDVSIIILKVIENAPYYGGGYGLYWDPDNHF
jgi:hypothetical protein